MPDPEQSQGFENFKSPSLAPFKAPVVETDAAPALPKSLWTPVLGTPEVNKIAKKTLKPEKEKTMDEMSFDELSSHLSEKKHFIDRNTPMNFFNNTVGIESKPLAPGEIDYGLSQGVAMTDMLNIDLVNSKLFAEKENFFGQATAAIYKGTLKGVASIAQGATYLADFDSLLSEDPTMDNAIASKIQEFKDHLDGYGTGSAPIHTRGGGAMDIGDSAWWANQLESAVTSSVQFGLLGAAGGLTLGLAVRSSLGALGASKFAAEKLGHLAVAAAMNKIESTQMAVEMVNDVQKDLISQGFDPVEAKRRAEEAASDFVLANKAMMFLDFGQLNTIFGKDKLLKQAFGKSKTKDVIAKATKGQKLATAGKMMGWEATEELLGDANQAAWTAEAKTEPETNWTEYKTKLKGALDFIKSPEAGASIAGGIGGGGFSTVTGKIAKKISGINAPKVDPLFVLGDMPEIAPHPGERKASDPGEFVATKKVKAEDFSQWAEASEEERAYYKKQADAINANAERNAKDKPYQDPLKTLAEESEVGAEFSYKKDDEGKDVLFKKVGDLEVKADVNDLARLNELKQTAEGYSKEDQTRYAEHLSAKEQSKKDSEEYDAKLKAHEETSAMAKDWLVKFKDYEDKVKQHEDYYETISANDTQRVLTEAFDRYTKLRNDIYTYKDDPKELNNVLRQNILGLVQRAYDNTGLDVLIAKLDIAKDATGQGAPTQEVKDMIAEILPTIKKGGSFYNKYNSDVKQYGKEAASKLIAIDDRIKSSRDNLKEAEANLIKAKNETVAYVSSMHNNPTKVMEAELRIELEQLEKAHAEAIAHMLESGVDSSKFIKAIEERSAALSDRLIALHPETTTEAEFQPTVEVNDTIRDAIAHKIDTLMSTMLLEHYAEYYKDPATADKKNKARYTALKTAIVNTEEPAVIDNLSNSVDELSKLGRTGMKIEDVNELRQLIKDKRQAIIKKAELANGLNADKQSVKTSVEESDDITNSSDPIQDLEDQEELDRLKKETEELPEDEEGVLSNVISNIKSVWSSIGSKISALSKSVLDEVNKYNPFITDSIENGELRQSDVALSSVEDEEDIDTILDDQTKKAIELVEKSEEKKKRGRPKGSTNKKKAATPPVSPETPAGPVKPIIYVPVGSGFDIEEIKVEEEEEDDEAPSSTNTTEPSVRLNPNAARKILHDALERSLSQGGNQWKVNTIVSHIKGVSDDEVASFMNDPRNMLPGTPVSLSIDTEALQDQFEKVAVAKGASSPIVGLLNKKMQSPSEKYDMIMSLIFKNETPVTIPIIGVANGQKFSMNITDSMDMVKAVMWAQCHGNTFDTKVLTKSEGMFTMKTDATQYVEVEGRTLHLMGSNGSTLDGISTNTTTTPGVLYEKVITANGESKLVALTVARIGEEKANSIQKLITFMSKVNGKGDAKFKEFIEESDGLPFHGMTTGDALNLLIFNGKKTEENKYNYPFSIDFKTKSVFMKTEDGSFKNVPFSEVAKHLIDYPTPIEQSLLNSSMTVTGQWFGKDLVDSYNEHIIQDMGVTSNVVDNDGIMFTSPVVILAHKDNVDHKNHMDVTAELVKVSEAQADYIKTMIGAGNITVVECS